MPVKRIVCLANSRKLAGRCIAGRVWDPATGAGEWIRPVSEREHGEVSEYERQYEDGSDPRVLDVVDVPLKRAQPDPDGYQTENWLLDPERYWSRQGRFPRERLGRLVDPVSPLWLDGDSTFHGTNDRVWVGRRSIAGSLRFIRVARVGLAVFAPREAFGNSKRRVQASFSHAGRQYALWVTDPTYERRFLDKVNGSYALGPSYLTVSLGEPFDGACYKLVAAVVEVDE